MSNILLWQRKILGDYESAYGKPLQIKKRISTNLFINRTAALWMRETQLRDKTNEGITELSLADWLEEQA